MCRRHYKHEAYHGRIGPRLTTEERFWAKVRKTETCWLWTSGTQRGYGAFYNGRVGMDRAHRYAYELLVGPIPEGLVLDHVVCENKLCVNPAHVTPTTDGENLARGNRRAADLRELNRTHCVHGHPWTQENTIERSDRPGRWRCRICLNAAAVRSRSR